MKHLRDQLEQRKSLGNYRVLPKTTEGIDFVSNDYLGLSRHQISQKTLSGSTGSRLLSGNHDEIEALELRIAKAHGAESALIYNSGYEANLGLISCIATRHDTIVIDEQSHASIIDGCQLSRAKTYKFEHQNMASLEKKLQLSKGNIFVITESIFSMNGSKTSLEKIKEICNKFNAVLIVDEAHSNGISPLNKSHADIRVVTYGKAFGTHGAAILGPKTLIEYLINFSRPFIYTTAPPLNMIRSIAQSYDSIANADKERIQLRALINYWNNSRPENFNWISSESQIQSVLIEGNDTVSALSKFLLESGIIALPIKSPTVKAGEERIRFCLHSFNSKSEIDFLFEKLREWKMQ